MKEPTRAQISSRLTYSQNTPRFLQKFQNRIAGVPDEDEDDQDNEFETLDSSGRPPIPKRPERPAIPERPADDPGSADEDDADEKPQVVVLKEGKHLTEWEAANIRRKEKGLPPLADPDPPAATSSKSPDTEEKSKKSKPPPPSLSFSTAKNGFKAGAAKRKAILSSDSQPVKKKPKKDSKSLLSFGDEA
ncbi:hypothetical protein C8F01DRAFT_1107903 [Mycena amicta]|nr:hypothetical protein C8F01DRAFT_1107903 [Mycena amicta]